MDDITTWIARAVYYHAEDHDPALDRAIAGWMDDARGCSGTPQGSQGGT